MICYGVLGFGYILPATFLPALAREVVDDPQMFGLAWPVFGIAAALSTVATGAAFRSRQSAARLGGQPSADGRGVVLPSLWLTPATIAIAALLVGSTFMVVTMIGMQEARARAPGQSHGAARADDRRLRHRPAGWAPRLGCPRPVAGRTPRRPRLRPATRRGFACAECSLSLGLDHAAAPAIRETFAIAGVLRCPPWVTG